MCHRTGGLDLLRPELAELYDAFETPRAERGDAPYLRRAEALDYMEAVRERSLEVLAATGPDHHVWSWWPSTSTSTTRRCSRPSSWPIPAPSRPSARAVARSGGRPATLTVPGGPFELGHAGRGLRLRQRAAAAPVELPRSRSTARR